MSVRFPLAALASLALALACSDSGPDQGAIITFGFEGRAETIRVHVTNPVTIGQAEQWLATQTGPKFPIGTIVRGAGVDSRYPFHYVPESVTLTELAIELCDGAPMTTPEAVDDFIEGSTGHRNAPSATWCPWNAFPLGVER